MTYTNPDLKKAIQRINSINPPTEYSEVLRKEGASILLLKEFFRRMAFWSVELKQEFNFPSFFDITDLRVPDAIIVEDIKEIDGFLKTNSRWGRFFIWYLKWVKYKNEIISGYNPNTVFKLNPYEPFIWFFETGHKYYQVINFFEINELRFKKPVVTDYLTEKAFIELTGEEIENADKEWQTIKSSIQMIQASRFSGFIPVSAT